MSRLTVIKMAAGLLAGVWASISLVLQVLLLLMALDFVTGIIVAIQQQKLESHRGYLGIGKKVIVLVLIATAAIIQQHLRLDLPLLDLPLTEVVSGFYIANEFISILENAAAAGVPVPSVLRDVLAKLNVTELKKD